jgi:hypothetical protein
MTYANEVDIEALNTIAFVWAQDISEFLGVYPLQTGVLRTQLRSAVTDPEALIEWSTLNGGLSLIVNPAGTVATATLQSPVSVVEGLSGVYVYDCRFEYQGIPIGILFGGTITFDQGVTRVYGDTLLLPENVPILASVAMTPSLYNALIFG